MRLKTLDVRVDGPLHERTATDEASVLAAACVRAGLELYAGLAVVALGFQVIGDVPTRVARTAVGAAARARFTSATDGVAATR